MNEKFKNIQKSLYVHATCSEWHTSLTLKESRKRGNLISMAHSAVYLHGIGMRQRQGRGQDSTVIIILPEPPTIYFFNL